MRRISLILLLVLSCFSLRAQTDRSTPTSTAKPRFLPVSSEDSIPAQARDDDPVVVTPATKKATVTPSASAAPPDDDAGALDDKHKLLAGDRLTFRILEDRVFQDRDHEPGGKDPNTPDQLILMVTDSGELNVPYIGLVTVSGKTCREAALEIRRQLEKDYYFKATVVLGLDQATKVVGHFYIYGYVKNPGGYDLPVNETFTAGKAISRAGGFSDFANKKNVRITRTVDGRKKTIEVNMVDILEKGNIEKDLPLLPDDYIFVDKRLMNFY